MLTCVGYRIQISGMGCFNGHEIHSNRVLDKGGSTVGDISLATRII